MTGVSAMIDLFEKIDSVIDAEVASEILNNAWDWLMDLIYEIQASPSEEADLLGGLL